jgi:hypothetical protein
MLWGAVTNAPTPSTVRSPFSSTSGSRHSRTADQGDTELTITRSHCHRVPLAAYGARAR